MSDTVIDEQTPLLDRKQRKATPLPKLQIAVILLLQVCEPLTSQSIYPYINQLVSELDIIGGDKRKVGYYAGLIESLFFATEALTVLQWSRVSDHIGRKPVMLIGLSGMMISMLCFGLSRNFTALIISRCLTGLLNGNIGVMKSVMGELTDSTNRAEGFALMPVVWGLGATLGPFIGGSLSRPHERFPNVFSGSFWKAYPYFLPCVATSGFVMIAFTIALIFFKETVPKKQPSKHRSAEPADTSDDTSASSPRLDEPLPLRDVLTYPVILSVSNYVALAFLNIAISALLPLFLAMPLSVGGLGFAPATIGYIIGSYGAASGIFQALYFSKIVRCFGERRVYICAISTMVPVFFLLPIISLLARQYGLSPIVWVFIVFVLVLLSLLDMAYGCIFMFVTASAPNRRSLGATNGLSQTTVSIARAIGPAMSTSLFSFSVERNILGGYGVYAFFCTLSVLAILLASRLPKHVWDHQDFLDGHKGDDYDT